MLEVEVDIDSAENCGKARRLFPWEKAFDEVHRDEEMVVEDTNHCLVLFSTGW